MLRSPSWSITKACTSGSETAQRPTAFPPSLMATRSHGPPGRSRSRNSKATRQPGDLLSGGEPLPVALVTPSICFGRSAPGGATPGVSLVVRSVDIAVDLVLHVHLQCA